MPSLDPNTTVQPATSGSNSVSEATSLTSRVLVAANPARRGLTIYNDDASNTRWLVNLGPTCSTGSYTVRLWSADYYEAPYGYLGVVSGMPLTLTGSLRIVELE